MVVMMAAPSWGQPPRAPVPLEARTPRPAPVWPHENEGRIEAFFIRNGHSSPEAAQRLCATFARSKLASLLFPTSTYGTARLESRIQVRPLARQGSRSYTLECSIGMQEHDEWKHIIQFRAERDRFLPQVTDKMEACSVRWVPRVKDLGTLSRPRPLESPSAPPPTPLEGERVWLLPEDEAAEKKRRLSFGYPPLHAYYMERLPGIPLAEFLRLREEDGSGSMHEVRLGLIRDLADHFVDMYRRFRINYYELTLGPMARWFCDALRHLGDHLPTDLAGYVTFVRFRAPAWLGNAEHGRFMGTGLEPRSPHSAPPVEDLGKEKIVLTHGRLGPDRILVHPATGRLQGVIGWADAEFLPFGMAVYGIEQCLGPSPQSAGGGTLRQGKFRYCPAAAQLRDYFWARVEAKIAVTPRGAYWARTAGILLFVGLERPPRPIIKTGAAAKNPRPDWRLSRDPEALARVALFLQTGPPSLSSGDVKTRINAPSWGNDLFAVYRGVAYTWKRALRALKALHMPRPGSARPPGRKPPKR